MSDDQAFNRRTAVRLGLFGGVAGLGAAAVATKPAQARSIGGIETLTRSELQQVPTGERNPDLWFLTEGDASGVFYPDPHADDAVDNLGVHVKNRSGLPYRRLTDAGQTFNVQHFGAIGDGTTDDTAAINAAIDALAAASGYRTLVFPPAIHYRTTETITIPERADVVMDTPVKYEGAVTTPAIVVGRERANNVAKLKLQVIREFGADGYANWDEADNIGLLIHNAYMAFLEIPRVEGFTIGVQARGSGAGFGYSHIHLGLLRDNWVALDLFNYELNDKPGWVNENIWYGGDFGRRSDTKRGWGNIGIRIHSGDDRYTRNNNNLFIKPCFELGAASSTPEKVLPIQIETGRWNRFWSCRNENNNTPVMRTTGVALENELSVGRGSVQVEDLGDYPTSVFDCVYDLAVQSDGQPLHQVSSVRAASTPYADGEVHVQGLTFHDPATGAVSHHGRAALTDHGLKVTPADHGIGLRVDLHDPMQRSTQYNWNRLVARASFAEGAEGSLHVVCLDADGAVMTPEADERLVAGREGAIFDWVPDAFGGSYRAGGNGSKPDEPYDWSPAAPADATYIAVAKKVAAVRVIWWARDDRDLEIGSVAVSTPDLRVPPAGPEVVTDGRLASEPPTVGTWAPGTFISNDAPEVADGHVIQGWLKVTTGDGNDLGTDWVASRISV